MERIKKFHKLCVSDKLFLLLSFLVLGLFLLAIIVPVLYIIFASFVDPVTLQNQGITFDFSKWTLTAYERVIECINLDRI